MEARVYHAVLWKDGERIEVHHFTLEPTQSQSDYRAGCSFNYLKEREAKKLGAGKPFVYRLHAMAPDDWEFTVRFERKAFAPDTAEIDLLPQFTHTSIWEMYAAVGYDYKNQKYTR